MTIDTTNMCSHLQRKFLVEASDDRILTNAGSVSAEQAKSLPRRSSRNTVSSKTAYSNPISTNSLYQHYLLMNKNNLALQIFYG